VNAVCIYFLDLLVWEIVPSLAQATISRIAYDVLKGRCPCGIAQGLSPPLKSSKAAIMQKRLKATLKKSPLTSSVVKKYLEFKNRERIVNCNYEGHKFYYPQKSLFGEYILSGEGWHTHLISILTRVLGKNPTIVEVGSNIGLSLLQMEIAKPEADYFCFEPSERFLPILKKNIKANSWNNVTLHSKILSSEAKTITLFNNSSTASPVVQEYDNHEFLFAQQIEATTLDTVFKGYEGKIDLIKVDTDGYDYDVLLGAQKRITIDQPILYFEFDPPLLKIAGRDPVDFLSYLISLGYNNFGVFSRSGKWLGFEVCSSEIVKLADQEIFLDLLALPEKDHEKNINALNNNFDQ
jgi:FkbM family methyltransferase